MSNIFVDSDIASEKKQYLFSVTLSSLSDVCHSKRDSSQNKQVRFLYCEQSLIKK